jgi:lactoylglutathione lyase
MKALETFPILSVAQLDRSLGFYRDLFGGDYRFPPEGQPEFVTLKLGDTTLGLAATTAGPDGTPGAGYTLCTYVPDCDHAVDRVRAAGHRVAEEPSDQPWGERIARVHDPDGYEVLLVARL